MRNAIGVRDSPRCDAVIYTTYFTPTDFVLLGVCSKSFYYFDEYCLDCYHSVISLFAKDTVIYLDRPHGAYRLPIYSIWVANVNISNVDSIL